MTTVTPLEGWVALPEAAERIGVTRQTLHFRINQGLISLDEVREVRLGQRKIILISEAYIERQALEEGVEG